MPIGLYIHIPFCIKRCSYCNFYTNGGYNTVPDEYIKAVINEINKYKPFQCKTVYFGGGTPSLLSPQQVEEILKSLDIINDAEITLEANPETATLDKLMGYKRVGINRLSIGVQTVNEHSLKNLGRIHSLKKTQEAFENAALAGFDNISGDMILATQGYSYKELSDTICALDDWGVSHISCYLLKVEEGTPLYSTDLTALPTEDEAGDYYLYACKLLEEKGFIQYEISNFAKGNKESKHNNLYWRLEDYLGIGPAAHSCIDNLRFYYPDDIKLFLETPKAILQEKVNADEYIMLSLRLLDGLDIIKLKEIWGVTMTSRQYSILKDLEKAEYLYVKDNKIVLTPKGLLVENTIITTVW